MSVSYTKEQRARAKQEGLRLCTVSTPFTTISGPFTTEEAKEIEQFIHEFIQRRLARRKAERTLHGEQEVKEVPGGST